MHFNLKCFVVNKWLSGHDKNKAEKRSAGIADDLAMGTVVPDLIKLVMETELMQSMLKYVNSVMLRSYAPDINHMGKACRCPVSFYFFCFVALCL